MKKRLRMKLCPLVQTFTLAAVAASPAIASADTQIGPYVGLEGGMNFESNQNVNQDDNLFANLNFHHGFVGGLDFGYAFQSGWRPEFEADYRGNNLKNATGFGGSVGAGGRESAYTFMGNLWYDFRMPQGMFSFIHPYIGAGFGPARVAISHETFGGVAFDSAHDTVLAYQAGAGLNFDVAPHVVLSTDYRFMQTDRGNFDVGAGDPVKARYRANTVMLGVKYMFGSAPPPPPPPPPPQAPPPMVQAMPPPPPPPPAPVCDAPPGFQVDADCHIIPQTVILRTVDFEFNSSGLTAPSQHSLDKVAAALVRQPDLDVEIDGHTDSIGGAPYNLRLSQRRSDAVKQYLIGKGVQADHLSARGFGKGKPIESNDTAEGRAQNRRVEFVVRNAPAHINVEQHGASAASTEAAKQGEQPSRKALRRLHKQRSAQQAGPSPADQPVQPQQ
ncbi:MAG: OmpA family protein [Reyranella sp.]|nr:OmpA family protein [Reyranella sp.]